MSPVAILLALACASPEAAAPPATPGEPTPEAPIVPASCLAIDAEDPLYVMAGAPAGGDGSAARPFPILQDAMDAADGETTVLIAPGSYARGFRAVDPRRHASLSVRGCDATGVIIKDTVLVAGRADARLGRLALRDVRVNARLVAQDVSSLVLEDVVVDSHFGGSILERVAVRLLGRVGFTSATSSQGVLRVFDSDVSIEGALDVQASHRPDAVGVSDALMFSDSSVDASGPLTVVVSGGDASVWEGVVALGFVRSSAMMRGAVSVAGGPSALQVEGAHVVLVGAASLHSDFWVGVYLVDARLDLDGPWHGGNGDQEFPVALVRDSELRALGEGELSGWVWVRGGRPRSRAFVSCRPRETGSSWRVTSRSVARTRSSATAPRGA